MFQVARQKAVFEFDTLEDLDTLMSPFRLRLLSYFRDPSTVKEAANRMGVQATRLYRHVNRLAGHGFLVITEERPTARTVERVYQTAGRNVRPSASFLERYGTDGTAELLRLGFRTVEADAVGAAKADPSIDPSGDMSVFGFTRLSLDEAELRELVEAVNALFRRFAERSGDIEVSFMGSVIPLTRGDDRSR
jgi:DNA-binding MarR family transcriptional regulator